MVIGFNPKATSPYVCWFYSKESGYFLGDFSLSLDDALTVYTKRVMNNQ